MRPSCRNASILVLGVALACSQQPMNESESPAADAAMVDREWELVAVGDMTDPRGSQGRPVTLRFDRATGRAVGFAGCNQYGAAFRITDSTITFEPPISTKMACSEGMDVEIAFLAALPRATSYSVSDSTLSLTLAGEEVMRFRAR